MESDPSWPINRKTRLSDFNHPVHYHIISGYISPSAKWYFNSNSAPVQWVSISQKNDTLKPLGHLSPPKMIKHNLLRTRHEGRKSPSKMIILFRYVINNPYSPIYPLLFVPNQNNEYEFLPSKVYLGIKPIINSETL